MWLEEQGLIDSESDQLLSSYKFLVMSIKKPILQDIASSFWYNVVEQVGLIRPINY